MKNRTPVVCDRCRAEGLSGLGSFSAMKPLLDFKPVPRRPRHDGWTPKRQQGFIAALAETGSVSDAAHAVNMTPEGAYYLRRQPGSEEFRASWEAALDHGAEIVDGAALERSIHGVAVPIFQGGKQVGERRVYNERLTMFLLQHRKPKKYGYAKKDDMRAAELKRAEEIREEAIGNHDERMARLSWMYGQRIRQERQARLEGNVIAADFYLRQLTHMEVLLELGGGGKYLLWWAEGGNGSGEDPPYNDGKKIAATEITEELDRLRREAWAEAAEPDRPKPFGNRVVLDNGMWGGVDLKAREAALKDARERAAKAQLDWEQAVRDQVAALGGPPAKADAASPPVEGEPA